MKTLIVVIILVIVGYFAWQYAPLSLKDKAGSANEALTPAKSSAARLFSSVRDKFGPEDPMAKRALLIDCLAESIEMMRSNYGESTLSTKIAYAKAKKESDKILEELRNENFGISSMILAKFVNSIIPAANSTATTSEPDCSSLTGN